MSVRSDLPRIGLVGVSGYSRVHLEHLWAMHAASEVVLAAVVVIDLSDETSTGTRLHKTDCAVLPNFDALITALPSLKLDLCIVPSPIHLHSSQTIALLDAGVHVLVEKPLAATIGEVDAIDHASRAAGRMVAVGFQYLHAPEVRALKQRLIAGEIGALRRISAYAAWPRSHTYYSRNNWVGRVRVGDAWVLDSPIANAMAHFFQLLLYFAGAAQNEAAIVERFSAELYRAQKIESFDTAVVSMVTNGGCVLDFYGTHSSREIVRPVLVIEGDEGRAEWVQDSHALLNGVNGVWRHDATIEALTREQLLRDVLARLTDPTRFVCTSALAREHVRCVNALYDHAKIHPFPDDVCATRRENEEVYTYIEGLDEKLAEAFSKRCGLRKAGALWAVSPSMVELRTYAGIGGQAFAP